MTALFDLVFALLDLATTKVQAGLKAEAKSIQVSIMQLLLAAMILAASLIFALAGLGMVLWGLYLVLEPGAGQTGAAFISGAIALLIAGVLIGVAKLANR